MRGHYQPTPFVNPENEKETYSGRGRHPKWLTMLLERTGKELVNNNGVWSLVGNAEVEVTVDNTQVTEV